MSAVEDQQEQDQQEQQFHHSQIYTKCVNRKTVLYAVWSYKCSFVLQSTVLWHLHKKYNFIKLDGN